MSDLNRSLLDAMTQYVIDNSGVKNVVKVTSYEETTESGGYCETCWDTWTEVWMTYDKIDGSVGKFSYYGSLAEFISDLTR